MFNVFLVSECKPDLFLPDTQFQIAVSKTETKTVVVRCFYVNQDLNCNIVNMYNIPTKIRILPLELTLTKRKWLIFGLY